MIKTQYRNITISFNDESDAEYRNKALLETQKAQGKRMNII